MNVDIWNKIGKEEKKKKHIQTQQKEKQQKLSYIRRTRLCLVKNSIVIGTRDSPLAMKQTGKVKKKLIQHFKSINKKVEIIIKPIKTIGDKILNKSVNQFGGKGIFTKELDEQLLKEQVDICVHSLKDIPVFLPEGISVSCFLKRDQINDVFVSLKYKNLTQMNTSQFPITNIAQQECTSQTISLTKEEKCAIRKTRNTVATSSLRRMSQIKYLYKNIPLNTIRGNINTRIMKLFDGYCDALILALCGLERLIKKKVVKSIIEKETKKYMKSPIIINYNNKELNLELLNIHKINKRKIYPALCQGIIAVTVRSTNEPMLQILKKINDESSEIMAKVERNFLSEIDGNCMMPIGGYATITKDKEIIFNAVINDVEGVETFRIKQTGNVTNYSCIGELAAKKMKQKIGENKLRLIKEQTEQYYKHS